MNKVLAKAKQRPIVAALITVGAVASALLAIFKFTGVIDAAVVSEPELIIVFEAHNAAAHPVTQVQIDLIRQETRCGTIDIQIAMLGEVIWWLEQTEPNGMRLVEKKARMKILQDRRDALLCAEIA